MTWAQTSDHYDGCSCGGGNDSSYGYNDPSSYGSGSGSYGSGYDSGYGGSGDRYTMSQLLNWSGHWPGGYVEGLGYVHEDTEIYGVDGHTNKTRDGYSMITKQYHDSPSSYEESRERAWADKMAEMVLKAIPGLGSLFSSIDERVKTLSNEALRAMAGMQYTGPIIVEFIQESRNTDMSFHMNVYSGGGQLLYSSK